MARTVVLVVDDDAALRELARAVLEDGFGAWVVGAATADAGLVLLRALLPDAVLLDLLLPGPDGLALLRRLAEEPPELRAVPVVAWTAPRDPRLRDRALALGCRAVVAKPFELGTLLGALAPWLRPAADEPAADETLLGTA